MFGDKIGVYARSCVLELCRGVSSGRGDAVGRCIPLLGLRNEIVVGIVTSVVMVRMKKGKNWPWVLLVNSCYAVGAKAHLFIVVVVGARHLESGYSKGGLTRCWG